MKTVAIHKLLNILAVAVCALFFMGAMTTTIVPDASCIVGFWPGDGDATDVANGNDGILVGGAGFVPGVIGQAFSFNEVTGSVVRIPEGTHDLDGFGQLTLSAWINVSSSATLNGIVTKYDSGGAGVSYTFFSRESQNLGFYIAQGDSDYWITETAGGTIPLNTWTHVAGVWDGADGLQVYIDGSPVTSTTTKVGAPTQMANNSTPVNIGAYESVGSGGFNGAIDEVRIYDCALAASEIYALYQTAFNQSPIADAGLDQQLECTSPAGVTATLDGTGSYDPDDDALQFSWDVPEGISLTDPSSATPSGVFPIGITTATLTVDDGNGGIAVDDVLIEVVDTTPPDVHCTTDFAALWPPNHQQVPVQIYVDATDACSNPGELSLISLTITSNEPDDGWGDGDTSGDVHGQNGFVAPVELAPWFAYNSSTESFEGFAWLRAERSGNGNGRTYTITATVADDHNNISSSSCVVVVPKNKRKP